MAASVRVGDKLPVALQLPDGAPNKFVRAWTYGSNGELVSGPTPLNHIAAGLYVTNTLTMPNSEFVAIQYRVYEDAAYTTLSSDYGDAVDTVSRTNLSGIVTTTNLEDAKNEIMSSVGGSSNQVKVAVSALTATDDLEFQTWLNRNGAPVFDVQDAGLSVMDASGIVIFSLTPVGAATNKGVFRLVKPLASTVVTSGKAYTVYATITAGGVTYASITSITVF